MLAILDSCVLIEIVKVCFTMPSHDEVAQNLTADNKLQKTHFGYRGHGDESQKSLKQKTRNIYVYK